MFKINSGKENATWLCLKWVSTLLWIAANFMPKINSES
jgi:hypothetical protein